jgi:hypothetical protein
MYCYKHVALLKMQLIFAFTSKNREITAFPMMRCGDCGRSAQEAAFVALAQLWVQVTRHFHRLRDAVQGLPSPAI